MNEVILEVKNIAKQYKQGKQIIDILNDINLSINQGELISIIGSSGSGKSTLMHLIGLLDSPNNGEVIINGQSTLKASDARKTMLRLKYLGFIYQHHYLLQDFNARENVALPHVLLGFSKKKALLEADKLLEALNISHRKFALPSELSGGEQQKVSIARALINKPILILADEPTGNLDPKNASEVFELFLKIVHENNIAALIVTHNHELAARSNKIYKLFNGNLVT